MQAALLCTEMSLPVSRTATAARPLLGAAGGSGACRQSSRCALEMGGVCACVFAHSVQGASVTMCLKKKSFIKQLYNKFLEVLIYNSSTKAHSCIPF